MQPRRVPIALGIVSASLATMLGPSIAPATAAETRTIVPPCIHEVTTVDTGGDSAWGMDIDPVDKKVYVAVDGSGRVDVISGISDKKIDTINVPNASVGFVTVDHAADTLYVSSFAASAVYAIDLSTEAVVKTIPVTNPQEMALNATTHRLYVAGQSDTVTVVNTQTNLSAGTLDVGGFSLGVAVDPGANQVFVGDYTNGSLDVFNGANNAPLHSWPLSGTQPITLRFDATTDRVWVTTRSPGKVAQIDPATGATGASLTLANAQGLALNPSIEQGYVTADGSSTLTAFDLVDGSIITTYPVGDNSLAAAARSGPVRIYATGLDDGSVTILGTTSSGPFPDVPGTHPFCLDIEWLITKGITAGYLDGTFRPGSSVTRQSMAAFLYREAGWPVFDPPTTPTFTDLSPGFAFYNEVEWLAAEGIGGGYPDGTFRPTITVTRQAMAAFLYRAAGSPAYVPGPPSFSDVPSDHPFFKEIEWLADSGISGGYSDGTFRPGAIVSRQAMSAFLHRFDRLDF